MISCSLQPPKPDLCSVVLIDGKTVLECSPTDQRKQVYIIDDIDTNALGYTCVSPRDRGDIKRFLKQVVKKLDEAQ